MSAITARRSERAGARLRTIPRALRTLTRCLVCGFAEVRTDEVVERGVLFLNECPRCDHRWTERPAPTLMSAASEVDAPVAA